MKRNEWLRIVGAGMMFLGGFAGMQSQSWGWITAIIGCGIMLLVIWLQHKE